MTSFPSQRKVAVPPHQSLCGRPGCRATPLASLSAIALALHTLGVDMVARATSPVANHSSRCQTPLSKPQARPGGEVLRDRLAAWMPPASLHGRIHGVSRNTSPPGRAFLIKPQPRLFPLFLFLSSPYHSPAISPHIAQSARSPARTDSQSPNQSPPIPRF